MISTLKKLSPFCKVRRNMSTKITLTKPITFVTSNKNKLIEASSILGDSIPIKSESIDLPELQGEDAKEIVQQKCKVAFEKINGPVFVEDTCLSFNALNGLPGPYIKWFLQKIGHDGLNKMLDGFNDRSGYASCFIAFCYSENVEPIVFHGKTDGNIVPARSGSEKPFGWDPIFEPIQELQPEGKKLTYAEMDKAYKNTISHRYRALESFKKFIQDHVEFDIKE